MTHQIFFPEINIFNKFSTNIRCEYIPPPEVGVIRSIKWFFKVFFKALFTRNMPNAIGFWTKTQMVNELRQKARN